MRFNYTKALDTLAEWARKEGCEDISFDHDGTSYIDWHTDALNAPRVIKIEGKHTKEIKTYYMLHELGHLQLRKDWDKFSKTLSIIAHAEYKKFAQDEQKYTKRLTYKVSTIEEEFKAWDEGLKLAEKLGIKVNMKKWEPLKAEALMSYIRYYGK